MVGDGEQLPASIGFSSPYVVKTFWNYIVLIMAAQPYEYTKNYSIVILLRDLYLNLKTA